MAHPQPQESSLLFSLSELRQIESDRVAAEEAERQAAVEAERQAAIDAERAARETAERQQALAEQRERERVEREAADRRAEALRLEQAEREARIAADAQIAQIRLDKEMELRRIEAERKRPVGLKLLSAVLVALALVLGLVVYDKAKEADRKAAEVERTRAEIAAIQERVDALIADKQQALDRLVAARTKADEEAAAAELAAIDAEIKEGNDALTRIEGGRRPPRRPPRGDSATARPVDRPASIIPKDCDPNAPLGCLDD